MDKSSIVCQKNGEQLPAAVELCDAFYQIDPPSHSESLTECPLNNARAQPLMIHAVRIEPTNPHNREKQPHVSNVLESHSEDIEQHHLRPLAVTRRHGANQIVVAVL